MVSNKADSTRGRRSVWLAVIWIGAFLAGACIVALSISIWRELHQPGEAVRMWWRPGHAREEEAYGYVDKAGRWMVKPEHLRSREFSEGLALLIRTEAKGGPAFIDTYGRVVFDRIHMKDGTELPNTWWDKTQSTPWVSDFHNGIATVQRAGQTIFFDRQGRELFSFWGVEGPASASVEPFERIQFSEGLAVVVKAKGAGVVDRTGHWVVPPTYDDITPFKDGQAVARKQGQHSILNGKGEEVARLDAAQVYNLGGDRFMVVKDDMQGLIDAHGHWFLPLAKRQLRLLLGKRCAVYDDVTREVRDANGKWLFTNQWKPLNRFSDGLCPVQDSDGELGKGYMDEDGKIAFMVDRRAHLLDCFVNGLAEVGGTRDGGYYACLMDSSGRVVIEDPDALHPARRDGK